MSTRTQFQSGAHLIDPTDPGWVDKLLAFHRQHFGDARMDAAGNGDGDGEPGGGGNDDGKGAGGDKPKVNEHGFPDNTPWRDMEPAQQTAYWQYQARKHEARAEATKDYDQVVKERDELKAKGLTYAEKALEAARKEGADKGAAEERAKLAPQLVKAKLEAASAGKIPPEQLAKIIEPLDLTKFLKADGLEVDTDKVTEYVAGLAPGGKKWPDMGQGHRGGATPKSGVGAGRSLYADRNKRKTA